MHVASFTRRGTPGLGVVRDDAIEDFYHGMRGNLLADIWRIDARGR